VRNCLGEQRESQLIGELAKALSTLTKERRNRLCRHMVVEEAKAGEFGKLVTDRSFANCRRTEDDDEIGHGSEHLTRV